MVKFVQSMVVRTEKEILRGLEVQVHAAIVTAKQIQHRLIDNH